jgi:hypothetical protein
VTSGGRGYDLYAGSAGVLYGLTSYAAVSVRYVYYYYDFPPGFDLPAGTPRRLDRQRVEAGMSLSLPLVRAGRAPGAQSVR